VGSGWALAAARPPIEESTEDTHDGHYYYLLR